MTAPESRRIPAGARWSWVILLILFGFFMALVSGPAARAAEAVVTDVRTDVDGTRARFVLHVDRRVAFRLFTLGDPYRVVMDLPEVGWRLPARPLPGPAGMFERLRYGLFKPGNSRVVFDFSAPVQVADAFVTEGAPGGANFELVLDLVRTTGDQFQASIAEAPREVAELRPRGQAAATQAPAPSPVRVAAIARRAAALVAPENGEPAAAVVPARYLPMPPRRPGGAVAYKPMIVLDPGHGGVDPGAHSVRGVYEKHVVLALAREIQRQLVASGRYRAELTRDRDIFIRLRERVEIARKLKADLFISVHADSIRDAKISGPSVYTLSEKASDKEAAELAERENKADLIAGVDLSHESADVANILIDLAQRESMNQSARFAGVLVRELGEKTQVLTRPHRFAGFAVLKAPDLPSVLLETGFLSNRDDERRLTSSRFRQDLGAAVVGAIDQYFQKVEQARVRTP